LVGKGGICPMELKKRGMEEKNTKHYNYRGIEGEEEVELCQSDPKTVDVEGRQKKS